MNEETPEDGLPDALPDPRPADPAPIVPFIPDEDLDLRPPEPTIAELMANGGRLLVTLVLREMPYSEYLLTNHWQDVRAMAFRVYGRRCTLGVECSGPLDVHHDTYDNRGDERPEDVQVLCRKHHKMKHDAYQAFVRAQAEQQFNRE